MPANTTPLQSFLSDMAKRGTTSAIFGPTATAVTTAVGVARGAANTGLARGTRELAQATSRATTESLNSLGARIPQGSRSTDPEEVITTRNSAPLNMRFPEDLQDNYNLSLSFYEYNRPSVLSRLVLKPVHDIRLPIPANVIDYYLTMFSHKRTGDGAIGFGLESMVSAANKATLDGDSNTNGLEALRNTLQTAARNIESAKDIGNQAMSNLQQLGGTIAGTVGAGAVDFLNRGPVGQLGLQSLGVAENPFTTIFVDGPHFKSHRFFWSFSPRSEQESKELQKIIYTLKRMSMVGLKWGGAALSYPYIVKASLNVGGDNDPYKFFFKFKPAIISSITLNYAPEGVLSTYSNKSPVSITVSMDLQEIELWFRDDMDMEENRVTDLTAFGRQGTAQDRFPRVIVDGDNSQPAPGQPGGQNLPGQAPQATIDGIRNVLRIPR